MVMRESKFGFQRRVGDSSYGSGKDPDRSFGGGSSRDAGNNDDLFSLGTGLSNPRGSGPDEGKDYCWTTDEVGLSIGFSTAGGLDDPALLRIDKFIAIETKNVKRCSSIPLQNCPGDAKPPVPMGKGDLGFIVHIEYFDFSKKDDADYEGDSESKAGCIKCNELSDVHSPLSSLWEIGGEEMLKLFKKFLEDVCNPLRGRRENSTIEINATWLCITDVTSPCVRKANPRTGGTEKNLCKNDGASVYVYGFPKGKSKKEAKDGYRALYPGISGWNIDFDSATADIKGSEIDATDLCKAGLGGVKDPKKITKCMDAMLNPGLTGWILIARDLAKFMSPSEIALRMLNDFLKCMAGK